MGAPQSGETMPMIGHDNEKGVVEVALLEKILQEGRQRIVC